MATIEPLELRAHFAAGGVDASFGSGGRVIGRTNFGPTLNVQQTGSSNLAVAGDGKIVLAELTTNAIGDGADPVTSLAVQRFNADGSPDTRFGNGGVATIAIPKLGRIASASVDKILVDSAGRITVLFRPDSFDTRYAARFFLDGRPDARFGKSGFRALDSDAATITDVMTDREGALLLLGTTPTDRPGRPSFIVTRLGIDGQTDTTYGNGGAFRFGAGRGATSPTFERLPDGRVSLAWLGESANDATLSTAAITANGALSAAYNGGLTTRVLPGFFGGTIVDLQADAAGRLTVAVNVPRADFSSSAGTLLQYNADGSVNDRFAKGGFARLDRLGVGAQTGIGRLVLDGGNRVRVVLIDNELRQTAQVRFSPAGVLDKTFGGSASGGAAKQTFNFSTVVDSPTAELPPGELLSPLFRVGVGKFIGLFSRTYTRVAVLNENGTIADDREAGVPLNIGDVAVRADGKLAMAIHNAGTTYFDVRTSAGLHDSTFVSRRVRLPRLTEGGGAILTTESIVPLGNNQFVYDREGFDLGDGDGVIGSVGSVKPDGSAGSYQLSLRGDEADYESLRATPRNTIRVQYRFDGDDEASGIAYLEPGGSVRTFPLEGDDRFVRANDFSDAANIRSRAAIPGSKESWVVYTTTELFGNQTRPVVGVARVDANDKILARRQYGSTEIPQAVFALADGRLLLRTSDGLQRIAADATIDSTFGTNGTQADAFANVDLDSRGRLVTWRVLRGGSADGDIQIRRFTTAGKLDSTFAKKGLAVVDTVISGGEGNVIVDDADRVVVTSLKRSASGVNWFATRLLAT